MELSDLLKPEFLVTAGVSAAMVGGVFWYLRHTVKEEEKSETGHYRMREEQVQKEIAFIESTTLHPQYAYCLERGMMADCRDALSGSLPVGYGTAEPARLDFISAATRLDSVLRKVDPDFPGMMSPKFRECSERATVKAPGYSD